jgi:hypothetical protein
MKWKGKEKRQTNIFTKERIYGCDAFHLSHIAVGD